MAIGCNKTNGECHIAASSLDGKLPLTRIEFEIMAWVSTVSSLDIPTTEITEETIARVRKQVASIDANALSVDELKQFFEFSRRLLTSKILVRNLNK